MTKDRQIFETLPALQKEIDQFQNESFSVYTKKLDEATNKALQSLTEIIEDGTLSLDPEQLVAAVKVLTTAKREISDSKRRLIETAIRGQAMMMALDDKGGDKKESLLDKYIDSTISDKDGDGEENSMFPPIDDKEQDEA